MSELSTKQKKAITALLSEPTTEAAAKVAGVTSRTIRLWLAEDEAFRQALTQAEAEALETVKRSLTTGANEALTTLRQVITNPEAKESARVRAAEIWLTKALALSERLATSEAPTIAAVNDVVPLLGEAIASTLALDNSLDRSRTVATLAGAIIKAFEVSELEARLEAIEQALKLRENDQ